MTRSLPVPHTVALDPFIVHHQVVVRDRHAVSFARSACPNPDAIRAQHATNHERAALDEYVIVADVSGDGFSGARIASVGIIAILDQHAAGTLKFTRLYARDRDRMVRCTDPRALGWIEDQFARQGVEIIYSSDTLRAPGFHRGRNGSCDLESDGFDAWQKAGLWRAR